MSRGGVREGAGRPKGEGTTMVRVPNGCIEAVRSVITDHRNGLPTSLQVQVYDWRPLTDRPEPGRKIVVWHGDAYQFAEHALNAEWLLHNLDNNKIKHIKAWCYQHPINPPNFES